MHRGRLTPVGTGSFSVKAPASWCWKKYEHARDRGATVLAEFAGYGATSDAFHVTQPDPEGEGAARAMKHALDMAGMAPEDITYINAHGTSTPLNDKFETMAVKKGVRRPRL